MAMADERGQTMGERGMETASPAAEGFDEGEIDLFDYVAYLWTRGGLILGITLACALAMGALAWMELPVYSSSVNLSLRWNRLAEVTGKPFGITELKALVASPGMMAKVVAEGALDRPPFNLSQGALPSKIQVEQAPDITTAVITVQLPDGAAAVRTANRLGELTVEKLQRTVTDTEQEAEATLAGEQQEALRFLDEKRQAVTRPGGPRRASDPGVPLEPLTVAEAEYRAAESLYMKVVTKVEEHRLARRSVSVPAAEVLTRAESPTGPMRGGVKRRAMVGALAGFGLTCFVLVLIRAIGHAAAVHKRSRTGAANPR